MTKQMEGKSSGKIARTKARAANKEAAPIVGVPSEAKKARARATAKGPKAGSAMASQSVKLSAEDQKQITDEAASRAKFSNKIDHVQPVRSGADGVVVSAGGRNLVIPTHRMSAELTKLAVVGGSYKAVEEYVRTHKPNAKLANGITGRDAPNAALAAATGKSAVGKDAGTKSVITPSSKTGSGKAAKKANAGGASDNRVIASVQPNPKRPGSASYARYAAYKVGMSVTAALAAGVTKGDIAWDSERGFITFK